MDEVEWTPRQPKSEDLRVGLISWAGSYLTYEACKSTVTAAAKGLGRRQTWEILVSNEHDTQAVVRLRSLQGLHLLCEADGSLCYGRPRTSHHGCFLLRFHRNGKWTLQCIISGRYLESDGEDVFCNSRVLSAYHMWTPRPALHVHVILYSPFNQCYARADPTMCRVWVDAPVPCREECGFLLHFQDGCYHLETSTHFFLSHLDRLVSQPSTQTAFHMQVRPGGLVALSDGEGGMLYAQGAHLLLGLGSNPHRGEEWFILQRCPTWVSLRSKSRKFLSIFYDVEVYATSEHLTPMSLFQFESNKESRTLQLRSTNGCYLAQRRHRIVMADGCPLEPETFFRMYWNCGRIILQSPSGRFLGIAPNSLLMANATIPGSNEEFGILLANRPFLVLRGRYGYVGTSSEHDLMQCNMDQPDCIHLLPCRQGIYHFQGRGLLVNHILWHLPPMGKVRPQLLHRASGEQLAHGASTQWLLHAIRPKRHPVGRQRGHYQRMYLGILGQWDATYQNPIPPGKVTTLNGTGTPECRSMRRISVTQLFLPSFAKHLFRAIIHHKRPPARPWCASDSVHSRGLGGGGGDETEVPGHSKFSREERLPNGNPFFH
ncbi:PREDICTED: fascin-3 isoform X1 [Hipposideros armiger]|uniref:Fascin-3 isoform X1 n=1 Tax=Hipposideros armiger TaxID=186990 RepID=A0A8B7RR75_HIPAR|nr:PREDICTED: fascin-3 isoform X1 [Hipposideros armiger]